MRPFLYLAALAALVSVTACESLEQPSPVSEISSVTITPPSATITVGQSLTLGLSVVAQGAVARTVTWTTSSAAVATIDGSGVVTGRSPGTVTIIATSTVDPTKAAAAVITVVAAPPSFANVTFNISATKTTDTGCNFSNSFTGQLQASGNSDGSNVTFRLIERLTRVYLGAVQPSGAFQATGNGDLGGFVYTGTISGQATSTTVQGVETLNFSSGCPGRQVVYQFTGTVQ